MNEVTNPSSSDSSIVPKYETSDAEPRFVASFGFGLIAMIAAAILIVGGYFSFFNAQAKKRNAPISAIRLSQVPPRPRLQSDPKRELLQLRQTEEKRLNGTGWVDRKKRIAHIPIQRAIDLLAEKGIPEPKAPEATKSNDSTREKGTP